MVAHFSPSQSNECLCDTVWMCLSLAAGVHKFFSLYQVAICLS